MGLDSGDGRWKVPAVAGGVVATSLYFFTEGPKYLHVFDRRGTVKYVPPPAGRGPRDGDGSGGGNSSGGAPNGFEDNDYSEFVLPVVAGLITFIVFYLASGPRRSAQHA